MTFKEFYEMLVPYADAIWKCIIMLQLFIISVILCIRNKKH